MVEKSSFKTILTPDLYKALSSMGIDEPTPIQEQSFSIIKKNQDVICQSSTGSGKTLAFALPLAEMIEYRDPLVALVLVPTRELCEQVSEEFKKVTKHKKLNIVEVYGGVSISNQIRNVPRAHVVVATPGRLCDLIDRRAIDLKKIKIVILDEADRMLDMGFIKDVEYILTQTPKERQTLMFSATIEREIEHLISKHMHKPKIIKIKDHVDKSLLKQYYYIVDSRERFGLLVYLLKKEQAPYAIVFCATRRMVDLVSYNLKANGLEAHAIHGGLTQNKRKKVMTSFHGKSTHILVASDIAARGIDVHMLSHVYNYDVPKTAQDYTHRIGRTARAGKEGIAVTLVTDKDYNNFRNVQRDRTLDIVELKTPEIPDIKFTKYIRSQSDRPQRSSSFSRGSREQRGRSRNPSYSRGSHSNSDRSGYSSYSRGPRQDSDRRSSSFSRGSHSDSDRRSSPRSRRPQHKQRSRY